MLSIDKTMFHFTAGENYSKESSPSICQSPQTLNPA